MCFMCFICPVCVGRKKIFGVKATGSNSFHRRGRSPSLEEGGLWVSPVKAYGLAVD